jgi:hypothetical protein
LEELIGTDKYAVRVYLQQVVHKVTNVLQQVVHIFTNVLRASYNLRARTFHNKLRAKIPGNQLFLFHMPYLFIDSLPPQ